jgi:hypothetical protein
MAVAGFPKPPRPLEIIVEVGGKSVYTGARFGTSRAPSVEWPRFNRPRILKHRAIIEFPAGLQARESAFRIARRRIKFMVNCPKCGAAVREEKAFCHNCGSPMDATMRQRDEPQPDFGATVIEPPRRAAPPFVPPAITEVQPTDRETAPVAHQQQQPATARVALPLPPDAQPTGRPKSSRKIGFGFVILLLFLMFAVFVLALVLD